MATFDSTKNKWARGGPLASLTDNSGGAAADVIPDVPAVYDEATLANIVASLVAKVNAILAALRDDGTVSS